MSEQSVSEQQMLSSPDTQDSIVNDDVPMEDAPKESEDVEMQTVETVEVDVNAEKDEDFSNDNKTPETRLISEDESMMQMQLNGKDTSFNAVIGNEYQDLICLPGDNFPQLYASTRLNYGVKRGRYYMECKFIDAPKNVRIGLSVLSEGLGFHGEHAFAFTSEGDLISQGTVKEQNICARWQRTDIVGLLINLPKKEIGLSINGSLLEDYSTVVKEEEEGKQYAWKTIKLPEEMFEGNGDLKDNFTLFPTIESKGSSLKVNMSQELWKKVTQFNVRTLGLAKVADMVPTTISPTVTAPTAEHDVEVVIPIAFDSKRIIDYWTKKYPEGEGILITPEALEKWADRSEIKSNKANTGQKHYNITCLDNPWAILPIMLRSNSKYLMAAFRKDHSLLKHSRANILARCNHAMNAKIHAVVDVDSFVKGEVTGAVREMYENLTLPGADEGFHKISYLKTSDDESTTDNMVVVTEEEGEEQAKITTESFKLWKKDCKLKSKVSDLKKGKFYNEWMKRFGLAKQLCHKNSWEKARMTVEKEREVKRVKYEEQKKKSDEAGEPCELLPPDEFPPPHPEPLAEFQDEDWLLAQLRAEILGIIHAFRLDVNDPERLAFAAIHFPFYYNLYTGKNFQSTLMQFQCKTLDELTRLWIPDICKHTAAYNDYELRNSHPKMKEFAANNKIFLQDYMLLEASEDLSDSEMDLFLLIENTEKARVRRQERFWAGDEYAVCNFRPLTHQGAYTNQPQQSNQQQQNGYHRTAGPIQGMANNNAANTRGAPYRR